MPNLPELIVAQPRDLEACCEQLALCPHLALDTEFVGEDTYRPDLCLIQVATPQQLYLIDPLGAGPLDAFWNLIVEPGRVVVVHAGREEMRICHFACGRTPPHLFDVQVAAGLIGAGYPVGYGQLLQQLLGVRLAKGETLTDWRRRPLTPEQVSYAFDDVRHLLALWRKLTARLERLGRVGWAKEEFESFVHRAIQENPAVQKWRKLRGLGSLDRRKLAIVRELFVWREEKAVRLNRPARFLLRDDLIVEIARRGPKTERDLASLRGLGKSDLAGILEAVNRARALAPTDWPDEAERDVDPPQVGLVASLLGVVLADFCQRQELTMPVAATTQDLRALVRARLEETELPASSPLNRGWRREHVLPELLAVLEGRWALRVADLKADSPFERVPIPPRLTSEPDRTA